MLPKKPAPWAVGSALRTEGAVWPMWAGAPMFYGGAALLPSSILDFALRYTRFGPSYGQDTDGGDQDIIYPGILDRTGIGELTCIVWALSNKNSSDGGGTGFDSLWDTGATENTTGVRLFGLTSANTSRWRLPEAAGNVDLTIGFSAGDAVQWVGRLGGGTQALDVWNSDTDTAYSTSSATSATISFNRGSIWIGGSDNSGPAVGSWPGDILLAAVEFRRWDDEEIEANRRDPFNLIRPAEQVFARVAAAGGGATIPPLAFHHRQQMMHG